MFQKVFLMTMNNQKKSYYFPKLIDQCMIIQYVVLKKNLNLYYLYKIVKIEYIFKFKQNVPVLPFLLLNFFTKRHTIMTSSKYHTIYIYNPKIIYCYLI